MSLIISSYTSPHCTSYLSRYPWLFFPKYQGNLTSMHFVFQQLWWSVPREKPLFPWAIWTSEPCMWGHTGMQFNNSIEYFKQHLLHSFKQICIRLISIFKFISRCQFTDHFHIFKPQGLVKFALAFWTVSSDTLHVNFQNQFHSTYTDTRGNTYTHINMATMWNKLAFMKIETFLFTAYSVWTSWRFFIVDTMLLRHCFC